MPPSETSTSDLLEACNRTELYQLCNRIGIKVSPLTSKEKLKQYLSGDFLAPVEPHSIDTWRDGLILTIEDFWTTVEAQLNCPAKELGPPAGLNDPPKPDPGDYKAPKACYTCTDSKVMYCLVDNAAQESLIKLRRKPDTVQKKEEQDMTSTGILTPATAPRTIEELSKLPRFQLKRLATELGMMENEKDKVAFIDGELGEQAQRIMVQLSAWDASQGNQAPPQATPQAPVAAPTPVQTAPAPAVVTPTATPPRTPRVNGVQMHAPSEVQNGVQNTGAAESILKALQELKASVDNLSVQLMKSNETQKAWEEKRHTATIQGVVGLADLMKTNLGATIFLTENLIPSATPIDVLREADGHVKQMDRYLAACGTSGKD